MTGHADPEEQTKVKQLEASTNIQSSPVEDLIELGRLYIEPCHREDEAIRLFEAVLERDPENIDAKFWLAYCCLYYLMDRGALEKARVLLESVIAANPKRAGREYMLLAEVQRDLGHLSLQREIELFEASVQCEPEWVCNRQGLASAYRKAGRVNDALDQLYQALKNVRLPDRNWSITQRYYEEEITGRTALSIADTLKSDIEDLKNDIRRAMKGL